MSEPTTEAGKALLEALPRFFAPSGAWFDFEPSAASRIADIEAEAQATWSNNDTARVVIDNVVLLDQNQVLRSVIQRLLGSFHGDGITPELEREAHAALTPEPKDEPRE